MEYWFQAEPFFIILGIIPGSISTTLGLEVLRASIPLYRDVESGINNLWIVKAPRSLLNFTRCVLLVIIPSGYTFLTIYSNPPHVSFENPLIKSICI